MNGFEDIINISDVTERVEELEEMVTPKFVAGWNMSGYMPDMEPAEFDNAEDAKDYIIKELEARLEESEESADVGFSEARETLQESVEAEFCMNVRGMVFWVTEDGEMFNGSEDEEQELKMFNELLEDIKGNGGDEKWRGDWYPMALIRESHFKDYAEELAYDCGMLDKSNWPYNCIDWAMAARELRMDYSSVEFDGSTFFYR